MAYTIDERLCVLSCLKEYIKRAELIRGQVTRLFISFVKPHLAISKDTLSRWDYMPSPFEVGFCVSGRVLHYLLCTMSLPCTYSDDIRQALNIEVVIAGAISCNPFVPPNGSVESQSNFTYR